MRHLLFNRKASAIYLVLFSGLLFSFNNVSRNTQPGPIHNKQKLLSIPWGGNFPHLVMPIATLNDFFLSGGNIPRSKKIVFRFRYDDGKSGFEETILIAFGAKTRIDDAFHRDDQGVAIERKVDITTLFGLEPIIGNVYLGNLELRRAQYINIMNQPGSETATHLLFTPYKSGNNLLYKVQLIDIRMAGLVKIFTYPETLNPSPPADPCTDNCND